MNRYFLKSAGEPGCYHVMDRERRNEFGEMWCEQPYLTRDQAEELVRDKNVSAKLEREQDLWAIKRRRAQNKENIPAGFRKASEFFLVDYHSERDPEHIRYGIERLTDSLNHARSQMIYSRKVQAGQLNPEYAGARDWRNQIRQHREFICAAELYIVQLRGLLAEINS